MAAHSNASQEAIYPLTLFDNMAAGLVIVMGWLVEGTVDVHRLERAVDGVVADWKLLGGRLERNKGLYQMRVPLGEYPVGYKRYGFTSQISQKPLSYYVSLPFGLSHDPLPSTLFKHPDTPRTVDEWIKDTSVPLLNWNVTHFPGADGETSHSCIGLTLPHAAFDGMGIASIVHAVEAELLGYKWSIPEELQPGLNQNALLISVEKAIQKRTETKDNEKYTAVGLIGFWWIMLFSAWSYWQTVWHQSRDRMLIMPAGAVQKLVEDTRREFIEKRGDDLVRLSKGDVMAGFLFKTIFCDEGDYPETTFRMCNLASLRRFFNGELSLYPHNCVIPLPYERYTAHELHTISLPDLAHQLAQARHSFAIGDALRCYDTMLEGMATKRPCLFFDPNVNESAVLTNVCIANITNINWTGTGAGRTLCRYKTSLRKPPLTNLTNMFTIAGYRDDGSLVIQTNLTSKRFNKLTEEIQKFMNEK